MKNFIFVGLVVCSGTFCLGAESSSGSALPRSSPEAEGVSPSAILAFVEAADKDIDAMHSFMLVRHGHVVAEGWWSPYDAETPHALYSLSKSFTSTAVGLAIAEGKLSIDDEVLKFFPDDAPDKPSDLLKAMRVSDLLRMSTGHQSEPSLRTAKVWTKNFLAHPVRFKPGTHFLYNTAGDLHALRHRPEGDGFHRVRLSETAAVRTAGHRTRELGDQSRKASRSAATG